MRAANNEILACPKKSGKAWIERIKEKKIRRKMAEDKKTLFIAYKFTFEVFFF